MKLNSKLPISIILVVTAFLLYGAFYGCIYYSIITFKITSILGLNPTYHIIDMNENSYYGKLSHAYVKVGDISLFLNPFREYGDILYTTKDTKTFINSFNNWGGLYNPINKKFYRVF